MLARFQYELIIKNKPFPIEYLFKDLKKFDIFLFLKTHNDLKEFSLKNPHLIQGLEYVDEFTLKTLTVVLYKKEILLKSKEIDYLKDLYLGFIHFLKNESEIRYINIIHEDANNQIVKKKIKHVRYDDLSYTQFLDLINPIDNTNYLYSSDFFTGSLIGFEFRFKKELNPLVTKEKRIVALFNALK